VVLTGQRKMRFNQSEISAPTAIANNTAKNQQEFLVPMLQFPDLT
jgi:hypothetical protein